MKIKNNEKKIQKKHFPQKNWLSLKGTTVTAKGCSRPQELEKIRP